MRQYERADIDYNVWYTDWMKLLAKTKTRLEIEQALGIASVGVSKAAKTHLRAIEATLSMSNNSQRRAQARNVVAAAGGYKIALSGALEIYDLFPEHTKDGLI